MRVTVIVAIFGLVVSLVGASPPRGLNARRMAQGLGPLPPVRRSPTRAVARAVPSGVTQCNTGTIQCCQQIMAAKEPIARWIAELAGVVIEDPNTVVGLACLPEPAGSYVCGVGVQPVCCQNDYNGRIAVDCAPVSTNLRR
ncbi:hypothetical protein NMY22_g2444 [Coprinellus aureogranulatus]|nr:hypothetical protein NMY22_g2444 [Coprinellus aureogranulatus]